jgi:hypothetical protein
MSIDGLLGGSVVGSVNFRVSTFGEFEDFQSPSQFEISTRRYLWTRGPICHCDGIPELPTTCWNYGLKKAW